MLPYEGPHKLSDMSFFGGNLSDKEKPKDKDKDKKTDHTNDLENQAYINRWKHILGY